MPKVSVIVPNYNHAKYLRQRIDSILSQTFQDFELILLDDCSTDNSVDILNEYANHSKVKHLVLNETNSGSTFKQWEKGLSLAQGEFIWIAESDDWSEYTFLEKMVLFLDGVLDVSLVYCETWLAFTDIGKLEKYDCHLHLTNDRKLFEKSGVIDGDTYNRLFLNNQINTIPNAGMVLFRKSEAANLSFEKLYRYKMCGDWFFWWSMIKGKKMAYCNERLNYFRRHDNVVTNMRSTLYFKERLLMLSEVKSYPYSASELKQLYANYFLEFSPLYIESKKTYLFHVFRFLSLTGFLGFYIIVVNFRHVLKKS